MLRYSTGQNIEATDQFARQFGVYAKGQLRKVGLPGGTQQTFRQSVLHHRRLPKNGVAVNVTFSENYATAGYFSWMF
jgi:hypothetical protein